MESNVDGSSIESSSSESNEHGLARVPLSKNAGMGPMKELSPEEIEQMKSELSKDLTPLQLEEFDRILNKFGKGTTTKDHVEGMVRKKLVIFWVTDFKTIFNYSIPLQVELIVFAVAIKSNATDVDITKIFNGDVQSTTIDTVTLNNI